MQTRPKHTLVVLPNNSHVEVSYFCTDKKLKEKEKKNFIDLVVQLHDCHCTYKIDKTILKDTRLLEAIVQKTVINAKGHLC
jgi:hypothetical protein